MKTNKIISFFLILILLTFLAYTQEEVVEDKYTYKIVEVMYEIKGITKKTPLSMAIPISKNTVFDSKEKLNNYIDLLGKKFKNLRTIESHSITPEFLAPENNLIPVRLNIFVKDTWNIIAIPYPKFDSNSGLQLKLKLKDFNFAGLLTTLNADITYKKNENNVSSGILGLNFAIPFKKEKLDFLWNISTHLNIQKKLKPAFNFSTGLDLSYKFKNIALHTGITQSCNVYSTNSERIIKKTETSNNKSPTENSDIKTDEEKKSGESNSTDEKTSSEAYNLESEAEEDQNNTMIIQENSLVDSQIPYYLTNSIYSYVNVEIYKTEKYGSLSWTPYFSISKNWKFKKLEEDQLKGFNINWSHSLAMGQVNWINNFRQGYSFNVENAYFYNTYKKGKVDIAFSVDTKGFYSFLDRIGISSQFSFYYNLFGKKSQQAGRRLRGILDRRINTDTAFSLNIDLPIKVGILEFKKITGIKWTKYLGFEFHIVPFLDIAFTHDEKTNSYYNPKHGWYAGGLEFIIYPIKMRSIYGRISIGYDLSELKNVKGFDKRKGIALRDGESISEIFIGIGLHY